MNYEMKKWFKMGTFGFFLLALPTLFTGCASNTTAVKETQKDLVGRLQHRLNKGFAVKFIYIIFIE